MKSKFAVIILAAGEGKRMKSDLPKVLHPIAEKPILARTLNVLYEVRPRQEIVVASPRNIDQIRKTLDEDIQFAIQKSPHGTADAARVGLKAVNRNIETVAVMYGDDTAFYKPETIRRVFRKHQRSKSALTFVTLERENPHGLGRILRTKSGELIGIVEEKDATEDQKKIKEINDGLYFFNKGWLKANLPKVTSSSVTGELYVTELIEIALSQKVKVETYKLGDPQEWHGINTPEELEIANRKLSFFESKRRIHFMGAAGAGASAAMQIAAGQGYEVSGCDLNPNSSYVQNSKLHIAEGHNSKHLTDVDLLIISPAVEKLDPKNPELEFAKKNKIPIISWQKFQGKYLQKDKFVIAVAGAYGKSTTTAMIAQIMVDAGLDPTCEIGAKVLAWETNFRMGKSKYYICEADEYNNNFLNYDPDIAVILNVGWDHPDFFKTKKSVIDSYKEFMKNIKPGGTLILGSDRQTNELATSKRKGSDHLQIKVKDFGDLRLSIIGDFRKENANAALTVAKVLNIVETLAKKSVELFSGLGRRLEFKGTINGVDIYDDYAVQPYTVLETADALKERFPNQKVCLVFEPHTFSRVETFFKAFVKNLKESKVDQILITDVYPAREKGDRAKLAQKLTSTIGSKAHYSGSLKDTAIYLKRNINQFDIILSMGAGGVYKLFDILTNINPDVSI